MLDYSRANIFFFAVLSKDKFVSRYILYYANNRVTFNRHSNVLCILYSVINRGGHSVDPSRCHMSNMADKNRDLNHLR